MKSSGAHGNVVGDASALENEDENKYLDQVRHILMNGERIDDLSGQFQCLECILFIRFEMVRNFFILRPSISLL
ncbi:hypothetical protein QQG55_55975 [Brugia pahangi]